MKSDSVKATVHKMVKYRCIDDCKPCGCPGHELRLTYQPVSESYTFTWVGERVLHFDRIEMDAMLKLLDSLYYRADAAKPLPPNGGVKGRRPDASDETGIAPASP